MADVRERLAAFLHGDNCTCPHAIEPEDLAVAEHLLERGVGERILAAAEHRGIDLEDFGRALHTFYGDVYYDGKCWHPQEAEAIAGEYADLAKREAVAS